MRTADNQSLSAVFLLSPTCISGQNGAIKTGEIGGLDFHRNKVHLFVLYFSDFLYFANLQLPDKTVFLHPKKYAGMAMQRNYFTVPDNFVWCKINNLPLVRLIILQPEDY